MINWNWPKEKCQESAEMDKTRWQGKNGVRRGVRRPGVVLLVSLIVEIGTLYGESSGCCRAGSASEGMRSKDWPSSPAPCPVSLLAWLEVTNDG